MWMEPNTPKSINERMSTIWQSRFGEKKWNKNIQNSDADFRKMQCQDVGYQDGSLRWSFPNYLMEWLNWTFTVQLARKCMDWPSRYIIRILSLIYLLAYCSCPKVYGSKECTEPKPKMKKLTWAVSMGIVHWFYMCFTKASGSSAMWVLEDGEGGCFDWPFGWESHQWRWEKEKECKKKKIIMLHIKLFIFFPAWNGEHKKDA